MNKLFHCAAALPIASGLLWAQTEQGSVGSKTSWTGLLVSAKCQTGSEVGMPRSTPTSGHGQNPTYEQGQNQADRSGSASRNSPLNATDTVVTPRVDSVDTRGSAPLDEAGLGSDDQSTAHRLDQTCRIGAKTDAFALRLPNGNLVPFDQASNAQIAEQLQSTGRLQHKTKIFRVEVKGTLRDQKLHTDSIKM